MTFDEIHRVIKKGDLYLLSKGLEDGLSPNLSNKYSWTLLMLAAMEGNSSIGRLLIEKGADLNCRNPFGDTALSCSTDRPYFVCPIIADKRSIIGLSSARQLFGHLSELG
jgi:ankyrin repeat protein